MNMNIAKAAWAEATRLRASSKVMLALFETGLVESGFKNYANSNVPASMKIPHDAVGHDHASVGFLQQQVPWWGTAAQCMNTVYATRQFVNRAKRKESRYSTAGRLAQAVQISAFPTRYNQMQKRALALIKQVQGSHPAPTPKPIKGAPTWPGRSFKYPPGVKGTDIKTWQSQMHSRAWNISVDGNYGPGSAKIAKQFQQKNGLTADGVVGRNTWNASWSTLKALGEPDTNYEAVLDPDVNVSDADLNALKPLAEEITPEDVYQQKISSFETEPDIPGF